LKKRKGYFLTRFLLSFDRLQKKEPVWLEDQSYLNNQTIQFNWQFLNNIKQIIFF